MRNDNEYHNAPPDSLTRDIGRRVRVLRAERGWSQEVLAELAGLHRNYIGHVERGEIHVSVVQLARIAEAFGLRPGVLIDGQSSVEMSTSAKQ